MGPYPLLVSPSSEGVRRASAFLNVCCLRWFRVHIPSGSGLPQPHLSFTLLVKVASMLAERTTPTDIESSSNAQESNAGSSGSRRRRGALSCAECRRCDQLGSLIHLEHNLSLSRLISVLVGVAYRLKLRCDRQVPCHSCVKRGCSSICPDGSLTTGKGNR